MDRRELRKNRDAIEARCNEVNKNKNISTLTGGHRRISAPWQGEKWAEDCGTAPRKQRRF